MARTFTRASSSRVNLGLGAGASITSNVTMAAICRKTASADGQLATMLAIGDTAGTRHDIRFDAGNTLSVRSSNNVNASTFTTTTADGWVCVVASKGNSTSGTSHHKYVYSSNTWTHEGAGVSSADSTATTSSAIGATTTGSNGFDGDIAIVAAWVAPSHWVNGVAPAAWAESLAYDLKAWFAVQPNGLWILDQDVVTQKIVDFTGSGANETGSTATTISSSVVPVFSYGAPILTGYQPSTTVASTSLPISPNSRRYAHLWRKAS